MKKNKATFKEKWEATKFCLKYPFLYPRNRFTDKHYNDWNLHDKIEALYTESYKTEVSLNKVERKCINRKKAIVYHVLKFWYDYPLQWFNCIPEYTEWRVVEKGWKEAFGEDILKELKEAMLKDGGLKYLYSVRILQIKEKWGRLNIYLNKYGDNTMKVLKKYENLSWRICIDCGKPVVGYTKGYVCPYCMDCYEKMKERREGCIKEGIEWFKFINEKDPDEMNMRDLLRIRNV